MNRLLQFVSFALATQVVLLLNQVVLLPMQIRQWGNGETAAWYAAIALATATTFADLGLRTAGHPELLKLAEEQQEGDAEQFRQVWAWIRVCLAVVSMAVLALEVIYGVAHPAWHWQSWPLLLTVAYALETLLIIRIVYLDSLGAYRGAEASYFAFAALRLGLAVPAVLVWKCGPDALAWLFMSTSIAGLAMQSLLCRGQLSQTRGALGLFARTPERLRADALLQARYTLAEPCANWVRISLPVLVIAMIAPPVYVTTYVALRAVFGMGRTTIQQISRVGSVEYLRLSGEGRRALGAKVLASFLLLASLSGAALALGVVGDNLRLIGRWLPHVSRGVFQEIALPFALTGGLYAYQILSAVLFRTGRLAAVAHRNYAYVLYAVAFAGVALAGKSLAVYLGLLVVAEVALSSSFLAGGSAAELVGIPAKIGRQNLACSGFSMIAVAAAWVGIRTTHAAVFLGRSYGAIAESAGWVLCVFCGLIACYAAISPDNVPWTVTKRAERGARDLRGAGAKVPAPQE